MLGRVLIVPNPLVRYTIFFGFGVLIRIEKITRIVGSGGRETKNHIQAVLVQPHIEIIDKIHGKS